MLNPRATAPAGEETTLTPEQRAAITHQNGPLLVVAGPGAGKTTVITHRVAWLVHAGIDAANLLIVTFTKAAADSMKVRTAAVAGPMAAARATFGTFHALAFRILRQAQPGRSIAVLDEDEQLYLIRQLMRQAGVTVDDDAVINAMADISRMRAAASPLGFIPRSLTQSEFRQVWQGYQEAKAQRGVMDFDDMLHEAVTGLQQNHRLLTDLRKRFAYLMIDEFQDTNPVQWELIRLLAAPLNNLVVVGDDDQSIYGWRGASPQFLLQFTTQYPGAPCVVLDRNHRNPPPIVAAANQLAAHNRERFGKVVRAVKPGNQPITLLTPGDSLQEAEATVALIKQSGAALSDWAVIYRTNQQAHAIAQALTREEIHYRALGGLPNLYKRWFVQDVLAYMRAAMGDQAALEGVLNRPNRYLSKAVMQEAKQLAGRQAIDLLAAIGQSTLLRSWQLRPVEELSDHLPRLVALTGPQAIGYIRRMIGYDDYLREYATREGGSPDEMLGLLDEVEAASPGLPLADFLRAVDQFSQKGRTDSDGEAVTLVTCHKAKGLEFTNVVVIGVVDKLLPHRGAEDLEEERRLLYVAMTRARERLWLSVLQTYAGREAQPSPFLAEALGKGVVDQALAGVSPAVRSPQLARPNDSVVRAVPKPEPRKRQGRKRRALVEPDEMTLPPVIEPGVRVQHLRHGDGVVESIDPLQRRVTIDFGGKRLSLDLSWCLSTPQFFRVLGGE